LPLVAIAVRIAVLTARPLSSPVDYDDDIIDHPPRDARQRDDDDDDDDNDDDDDDDAPPPEPLDVVAFCAEKCRYVPAMCTSNNIPRKTLASRTDVRESIDVDQGRRLLGRHGARPRAGHADAQTQSRHVEARELGGEEGEGEEEGGGGPKPTNATTTAGEEEEGVGVAVRCEDVPSSYESPMMFPEEFEFVVKLLANSKPDTYLEWGTGMSTSFYPLLASGTVIAIDGYPPWCRKVGSEPRVRCMAEHEGRLRFHCPERVGADGRTRLDLRAVGKLPPNTSDEDVKMDMGIYVNSVAHAAVDAGVGKFDAALVDGRYRMQCALRLLPYLNDDSVLIMHDFWVRLKAYEVVLDYYYVIGYARSVVALKKKRSVLSNEEELIVYEKYMTRDHLTWTDLA
jgi:hypothetical protein